MTCGTRHEFWQNPARARAVSAVSQNCLSCPPVPGPRVSALQRFCSGCYLLSAVLSLLSPSPLCTSLDKPSQVFLFNSFIEGSIKEQYIFNVYNLRSLDKCEHPWCQHHTQADVVTPPRVSLCPLGFLLFVFVVRTSNMRSTLNKFWSDYYIVLQ